MELQVSDDYDLNAIVLKFIWETMQVGSVPSMNWWLLSVIIKLQDLVEHLIVMILLIVITIWIYNLLKLYKHGYSKVTDHATREIDIKVTREDGLRLVRKYELKPLSYLNKFCEWLEINEKSLNFILINIEIKIDPKR